MDQNEEIIEVEVLTEMKNALSAVVHDTDMKKNRWGLWDRCKTALQHFEDLQERKSKYESK